jgi:hypothetical protein
MVLIAALAFTVMIEKLCNQSPAGFFQASHKPARAYSGSSRRVKRKGTLRSHHGVATATHSTMAKLVVNSA